MIQFTYQGRQQTPAHYGRWNDQGEDWKSDLVLEDNKGEMRLTTGEELIEDLGLTSWLISGNPTSMEKKIILIEEEQNEMKKNIN